MVPSLLFSPQWPTVSHSAHGLQKPTSWNTVFVWLEWWFWIVWILFIKAKCIFVLFASASLCPSDSRLSGDSYRCGDLSTHCRLCVSWLGPQGHEQRFSGKVSLFALSLSLCHTRAPSLLHTVYGMFFHLQQSAVVQLRSAESSGKLYKVYIRVCLTKSL